MKTIKIGYTDIYPDTNPTNNVIYNILKERYNVEIIDTSIPENRDKVEYLIYSVNGKKYLDYNCVRIFVTGENLVPEFNLCDYAVGFEHMSFGDRFFRLPIYFWELYRKDYDALLMDRNALAGSSPEKRDFCGIVASNNYFADPMRENFLMSFPSTSMWLLEEGPSIISVCLMVSRIKQSFLRTTNLASPMKIPVIPAIAQRN